MAKVKQLPAKSKTAAAKRALAKKAKAKKTTAKKTATTAAAAPAAALPGMPAGPENAQGPVSSPTGSLTTAEDWGAAQARLQSLNEDADSLDELNQADVDADTALTTAETNAKAEQARQAAELKKSRDEFRQKQSTDYKDLNSNMASRGASRSSAMRRGADYVGDEHLKVKSALDVADSKNATFVADATAPVRINTANTKAFTAKRRGTLASRAAAGGVYSPGSSPEDGGVTAPGINEPAAPAPKAPKAPKAKAKLTPAQKAKAAKKRLAKKKGK